MIRSTDDSSLTQADAPFTALLEGITDGLCLLDRDWTIRYINAHAAAMLASQCAGKQVGAGDNLWLSCARLSGTELETQCRRAMAEQRSCNVELYYPPLGGWLEVRLFPSADGLVAYISDINERKAAQESLRQSEADLRALADAFPQLAWIARTDGAIIWCNQRWHDYTGISAQQMAGDGWRGAYDPQELPQMLAGWRAALRSGTPFEMEFPIRARNGQYRWFLTRANPMRDQRGQILRWFGTSTDVDQVRHVHEDLRDETRVLELLNSTGATLAGTLNLPALLQAAVDAATQISGARHGVLYYGGAGTQGGDDEPPLPEALAVSGLELAAARAIGPALRHGPALRLHDTQADQNTAGAPAMRSCLSLPVRSHSGRILGRLLLGHPQPGMFSARSERIVTAIANQAAMALDNTRLYAEAQRAAEERRILLDSEREARAEAEHTNRLKDEFLASLSHELRTPLSAILGWAQVLARGARAPADLQRGLQSIERNARAQAQLIEDLLDMSRISASGSNALALERRPVAPEPLIAAALDSLQPVAQAKHISVHTEIAADAGVLMGDPARLQQVLWNLLSNAFKFTPQDGRVSIAVRREGNWLLIIIADNGVGIRADFLPHVFDRFRQADASTTRKHGGLGLGLAIVNHLVLQHGGSMSVSSPGEMQGATFTVRLPVEKVPEPVTSLTKDDANK
ncbi:sensor histidine kinase [Janthinobacterium aquaticum]|uniref:sensor histidine kinase n=1 Tax=Janthinobacterium sp. FT58W TaxID=2654254 RepID=UPI001264B25E|nr:ATP-binding protein [Janthinobacterium sp. FT58W]KAB8045139.1 PAS domain-containing protein [Janthinobacterium sp. FT58W]